MQRFLTIVFGTGLGIGIGVIASGKADAITWATVALSAVGLAATIFFREKKKK
jgi:hypothetical protein